jgi:hypothetical protein
MSILQLKKKKKKLSSCTFFSILVIETLDPNWLRIRIGIQPKTMHPDSMNLDPKH